MSTKKAAPKKKATKKKADGGDEKVTKIAVIDDPIPHDEVEEPPTEPTDIGEELAGEAP